MCEQTLPLMLELRDAPSPSQNVRSALTSVCLWQASNCNSLHAALDYKESVRKKPEMVKVYDNIARVRCIERVSAVESTKM